MTHFLPIPKLPVYMAAALFATAASAQLSLVDSSGMRRGEMRGLAFSEFPEVAVAARAASAQMPVAIPNGAWEGEIRRPVFSALPEAALAATAASPQMPVVVPSGMRRGEMRRPVFSELIDAMLVATGALAQLSLEDLNNMRTGQMRRLVFSHSGEVIPDTRFFDQNGKKLTLGAFAGKTLVVNFWATWCAPCRKEMPTLDSLQRQLGGDKLEVLAIATGRNPLRLVKEFYDDKGIDRLEIYLDPSQRLARKFGVIALPATVVIDPFGYEKGRAFGDVVWDSPEAIKLFRILIKNAEIQAANSQPNR